MSFVGMDIHQKTTTYCVIDDEGRVVKRGKVDSGEDQWLELVGQWSSEEIVYNVYNDSNYLTLTSSRVVA